MADLKEYKCLNCSGAINFDAKSQQMKCPFCDSTFEVAAFLELQAETERTSESEEEVNWTEREEKPWEEGEQEGLRVYVCNTCAGEVVADKSTAATNCPYCRNPVVMKGQLSGSLRPDCIIPFQLNKEAAIDALTKHLSNKRLLPKSFKTKKTLDEITGVYVPFWLFNADIEANMRYKATKVRTWSDARFIYTETKHFNVARSADMSFDNVPVDASSKMPDDLMESIEPFNTKAAVGFKAAFLAGYMADKFDYTSSECINRANERIRKSAEIAVRKTVTGYSAVIPEYRGVYLKNSSVQYALLPVWVMTTTWRETTYLFAMNGQTGKFVGNLPTDWRIFWRLFTIWTVGIAAVLNLILLIGGMIT
jgi:DNA-directed RNA polymerase subunit RPC12/RpoP